ncbi:hypothetical protein [Legionella drozanskii]|nr:hypothetical protein [Legionella drozanskii]
MSLRPVLVHQVSETALRAPEHPEALEGLAPERIELLIGATPIFVQKK